jgi:1,4-alpha-glucan branching enzyme
MKTAQVPKGSKTAGAKRVPIEVKADGAQIVAVTGDFNRWAKDGILLTYNGNGTWRTVLQLAPGEYQYRLVVDGEWRDHPAAGKRVPNPFGTENGVLVVT